MIPEREAFRKACEQALRMDDCIVVASERDHGGWFGIGIFLDGWRHAVAVKDDDTAEEVAAHLRAAINARRTH